MLVFLFDMAPGIMTEWISVPGLEPLLKLHAIVNLDRRKNVR